MRTQEDTVTRRRTTTAIVAAVVTASLSGSCSTAGRASVAPLSFAGAIGELCLPAGESTEYTYGVDALGNPDAEPVAIDGVTLLGAHGLSLEQAFLTPAKNMTLVGAQAIWPPSQARGSAGWTARATAAGATIRREDGARNLVLRLSSTGPGSGFAGTRIDYHVGQRRFSQQTQVTFHIERGC
jgi:hypothetical protein